MTITAAEGARRIAALLKELEDEGLSFGGHWSGDLLIVRTDRDERLGAIRNTDPATYWGPDECAGIGWEKTSESGDWHEEWL